MWPAKLKILTVYPLAEKYMMTLTLDSQACGFSGPFPRWFLHTHIGFLGFLSSYTPVMLLPLSLCIWMFLLPRMFYLSSLLGLLPYHLQVFAQMSLFTQPPIQNATLLSGIPVPLDLALFSFVALNIFNILMMFVYSFFPLLDYKPSKDRAQ